MSVVKNHDYHIRLCALKVRYRQAWKRQASSCELAALLGDIEKLEASPHVSISHPLTQ